MRNITTKFEGTRFWCDVCRKIENGQGYIYNGKAYCEAKYQKKFPLWKKEEK